MGFVLAVVERYDMDEYNDMPGLKYPVKYYEIGDEFSTYEPESVSDTVIYPSNEYHIDYLYVRLQSM